MRIGVIGSMHFTERMLEVCEQLKKLGHEAFVTSLAPPFVGLADEKREDLKTEHKLHHDAIREFWRLMQGADAVLVMNFDRRGVKNYIGGNTLMEIGFAHVLNQKIFLWNPIPDIPYYRSELEGVKPVIIHGDLSMIR